MYLADIPAADAASRHPDPNRIGDDIAAFELSDDEKVDILAAVRVHEDPDETETAIIAAARRTADKVRAVTWEMIRDETARDSTMQELSELARKGFPDSVNKIPKNLSEYWRCREGLYEVNGVILYEGRIVIPLRLRNKVSTILHIAHQGTSQMGNRAVDTIFWPGYTADLGRRLKDAMPFKPRSSIFGDDSPVARCWKEVWSQKEKALAVRIGKATDKLDAKGKELAPLDVGDVVRVQNQH